MFVALPPIIEQLEEVQLFTEVLVYFIVFIIPSLQIHRLFCILIHPGELFLVH